MLTLSLPKEDLALATRLVLKAARSNLNISLFFEEADVLIPKFPFYPSPPGKATPEIQQWFRDHEAFPPLVEVRKRMAMLLAERLTPYGFEPGKGDVLVLRRITAGRIEHSVRFSFSMHLGTPRLDVSVKISSLDLRQFVHASWLDVQDGVYYSWSHLPGLNFDGDPFRLYTWDDLLDIVGCLERVVLPLIEPLDSFQSFEAWINGRVQLPLPLSRLFRSDSCLAAARLVASPDYEKLRQEAIQSIEGQEKWLPEIRNSRMESLSKIINWLDNLPPGTIPPVEEGPDVLPYEKDVLLERAQRLLSRSLCEIGFKKKSSSRYDFSYERLTGEMRQLLNITFLSDRENRCWKCLIGVECLEETVEKINKAANSGYKGCFLWALDGPCIEGVKSPSFSTWSEFDERLVVYRQQASHLLDGIDGLAALQSAYHLESSPRYDTRIFNRNLFFAYIVAAMLGGPFEADIMSKVRTQIAEQGSEGDRSRLKTTDKAIKKVLGKVPAGAGKK